MMYTDGNIIVKARSMTDVEYFRDFDNDPNYPDDEPKIGMFVCRDDGVTMAYAFYPDVEKFHERFKPVNQ